MGWFSSSSSSSAKPEDAAASTRDERGRCWEARDAYFACLDRAGVVKAGEEGAGACGAELAGYEGRCARSWIEYFNQRRVIADAQKDRLAQANTQFREAKR